MATMSVMAGMSATHGFRAAARPAGSVRWLAPRPRKANPVTGQHVAQVADVAMRFAMALVPFSALAWMFIAR